MNICSSMSFGFYLSSLESNVPTNEQNDQNLSYLKSLIDSFCSDRSIRSPKVFLRLWSASQGELSNIEITFEDGSFVEISDSGVSVYVN